MGEIGKEGYKYLADVNKRQGAQMSKGEKKN